jgi:hypothetical protein
MDSNHSVAAAAAVEAEEMGLSNLELLVALRFYVPDQIEA